MNDRALKHVRSWSIEEAARLGLGDDGTAGSLRRVRVGLGGSHTVVTYPPLDALEPVSAQTVTEAIEPTGRLNLYAHVAFCEFICPFCHYVKTLSRVDNQGGLAGSYVEALYAEIERWMALLRGSTLASIYIGGGTPTAMPTAKLVRLVEALSNLTKEPHFRACVETSPLTVTAAGGAEKLCALRDAGVNRFSIGVQSFNDYVLRHTRGHGRDAVLQALEAISKLGVEFNVDLMQDLPFQTEESLIDDLEWVDRFRPPQVTWYIMRLHQEASWYRIYSRGDLALADSHSARWRLLVREGMRRLGYTPIPGGRFVLDAGCTDLFKEVRAGTESRMLGMGASAYSHGWGWFFRNSFSQSLKSGISGYVERIRQNGFAVETALPLDPEEQAAGALVAGIRSGMQLPSPTPETQEYLESALGTLRGLHDSGFVQSDATGTWSLTELGALFEEEICSLFYTSAVKQRLGAAYWATPGGNGRAAYPDSKSFAARSSLHAGSQPGGTQS